MAAIMIEPITASNCRIVPPDGYMQKIREICDDYELLLIFDEVMSGFGRTGEWFAADHWGVAPDIMTLAKGINSGYLPVGAVMTTKKIAEYFDDRILYAWMTQSGNPVGCAAAIASIQVYEEEKMIENSKRLGYHLMQRLERIKEKHPCVGDARGKGLFAAIDLVKDKDSREPLIPWTVYYYENEHSVIKLLLGKLKEEGLFSYMRGSVLII